MFITFGYKSNFNSILRALVAIAIGLVMIIANNATITVVKIIAAFLIAAGVVSIVRGIIKRNDGTLPLMVTNAIVDILFGLLLFFYPQFVGNFIVYLIGIALVVFGGMQLLALSGAMSLLGAGFATLILSIFCIIGGILLLFNPFGIRVMSIIAGCLLVIYGVSELISTWRMNKAKKAYEIKFGPAAQPQKPNKKDGLDTSGIDNAVETEYHKVEDDTVDEQ
jgi:uncharacterized membrane protein HdeD (DUF308 family)